MDIIGVVGLAITAISLTYAIKVNREKAKVDRLVKVMLANFAGSTEAIRRNPHWADKHFRNISEFAKRVNQIDIRNEIVTCAHMGARDVASAERMLRRLRNDILSLQEGLYGTRDIDTFDIPNTNPTFGFNNNKQEAEPRQSKINSEQETPDKPTAE